MAKISLSKSEDVGSTLAASALFFVNFLLLNVLKLWKTTYKYWQPLL